MSTVQKYDDIILSHIRSSGQLTMLQGNARAAARTQSAFEVVSTDDGSKSDGESDSEEGDCMLNLCRRLT